MVKISPSLFFFSITVSSFIRSSSLCFLIRFSANHVNLVFGGGGRLPLGFGTHSYTFFLSKELSKLPAKFRMKCFSSFPYWFNEEIECSDRNVSLCFILKFLFVVSENLLLKMCQLTRQFNGESMELMFGQNILNYLTNFFLVIKLRKM